MTFQSFCDAHIPFIDAHLKSIMTPLTFDGRQRLESAMAYSVLAPAKRIRPLLVLAVAQEYDADFSKIIDLACAIELIHCYSLIHDDLPAMDNDDYRRGQPTCHRKFDEATAILAGDTLQSYSFERLSTLLPHYFSAEKSLQVIAKLAHAYGINGLAGGQMLDLCPDFSGSLVDQQNRLIQIHNMKTGALMSACVTLPGYLYTETPERQLLWAELGQKLGLLFQIVDDILDVTSSREIMGKSAAKDIDQNKLTYVSLFGLDQAKEMAKNEANCAYQILSQLHCSHPTLTNLVEYLLFRNK